MDLLIAKFYIALSVLSLYVLSISVVGKKEKVKFVWLIKYYVMKT
jgi:hypothetical protein